MIKVELDRGNFKQFELTGGAADVMADLSVLIKKCVNHYVDNGKVDDFMRMMVILEKILSEFGFSLIFDGFTPPSKFKTDAEKEAEAE